MRGVTFGLGTTLAALAAVGVAGVAPGTGAGAVHRAGSAPRSIQTLAPDHRLPDWARAGKGGKGHGHGGSSTSGYGWSSSNWSGYAVTPASRSYTAISGSWTVPSVAASKGATYSATWIGIDGFNNDYLIQTGTEQDYYDGSPHYATWWTDSENNFEEQPFSLPVSPGDVMTASIIEQAGGGPWTITLTNDTAEARGATDSSVTELVSSYDGPGASAEWIMEAPTIGGRVAPLADYGETNFTGAAVATSVGGTLTSPGFTIADGGYMVQHRSVVSIPSEPGTTRNDFNIAYGSAPPSAP